MPFSCKVEFKGANEFLRDLQRFKRSAVPYAIRNALNTAAFEARSIWQREQAQRLTLRNKFRASRTLVVKATGRDPNRMEAVVGSATDYLDETEKGATVRGKGRHKNIPMAAAAGLPQGSKRTKAVRPSSYLSRIRAVRAHEGKTPKQRNFIALTMASKQGNAALLERKGGGHGLYRVSGGLAKFAGNRKQIHPRRKGERTRGIFRRRKFRIRMLWDLSRGSVRVPATPTLKPTLKKLERKLPHIYSMALLEQLRRHRVFGY